LSGGEQQIVAYIRARNSDTPILIMDEPFSAVDKHSKQLLMEDIASLTNKTVIMITHDIDESLNYFDKIIKMDNGHIS
jgi:ABC-type proline/glycine betaine transport system ATPase subunit